MVTSELLFRGLRFPPFYIDNLIQQSWRALGIDRETRARLRRRLTLKRFKLEARKTTANSASRYCNWKITCQNHKIPDHKTKFYPSWLNFQYLRSRKSTSFVIRSFVCLSFISSLIYVDEAIIKLFPLPKLFVNFWPQPWSNTFDLSSFHVRYHTWSTSVTWCDLIFENRSWEKDVNFSLV